MSECVSKCEGESGYVTYTPHFQGNYVPSTEAELLKVEEQYDVILCLSLTKWVHLNWGDNGVRLLFRKIYHHLRPGGRFLLEPQPWKSYERRMKLTVSYELLYSQPPYKGQPQCSIGGVLHREVEFL